MKKRRYALTLDLVDDPKLIREYEKWHERVWPEIKSSILESGIQNMEIYRFQTRLFMLMEVGDGFSFESKAAADHSNERVQEWERLMWKYQKPLPGSRTGEKWRLMERIFSLVNN